MRFRVLLITHYLIREILVEATLDVHIRNIRIKNFIDPDVVTMHFLQKEFMCWYVYIKPYVSHYTMVERMVESTSSATNVYGVVDNNNNPYRNMVMNVMRMNQGVDQCPIIDEEPNTDTTSFFIF